ncbi:PilW family protein [Geobacter sp.]|uniref:PilW family protein n=1 Tax=Geobacter sp. TaxID=46610 RepID=UPI001AD09C6E|nr:prepilin-type N-terminal cleavage/methylation domain-containing protein [Geobacter sp.]CAG0941327.1 hypothetical protein ANRL1_00499 [Anaerolineae bacterium]
MMGGSAKDKSGFTLVELLVVMGIFGVIMGAVYSVYLTHLRNAYSQEELVDVQQNLRTAMDVITRDLRMAGTLVPFGINPLAQGTLNNYSTSVQINTASATGRFARITKTRDISGFSNFSTAVDTVESADGLEGTGANTVRLIRPIGMGNPVADASLKLANKDDSCLTVVKYKPLTFKRPEGSSFATGTTITAGDMIAAVGPPTPSTPDPRYDTIIYSLGPCDSSSALRCLQRRVNLGTAETIAGPFSSLCFSYLNSDGTTENNTPDDTSNFPEGVAAIRGVRITLTGATTTTVPLSGGAKTRQITSVVTIRNRR